MFLGSQHTRRMTLQYLFINMEKWMAAYCALIAETFFKTFLITRLTSKRFVRFENILNSEGNLQYRCNLRLDCGLNIFVKPHLPGKKPKSGNEWREQQKWWNVFECRCKSAQPN